MNSSMVMACDVLVLETVKKSPAAPAAVLAADDRSMAKVCIKYKKSMFWPEENVRVPFARAVA